MYCIWNSKSSIQQVPRYHWFIQNHTISEESNLDVISNIICPHNAFVSCGKFVQCEPQMTPYQMLFILITKTLL
ncbi:unnamed protein product, partial [Schistosoma guineensis]